MYKGFNLSNLSIDDFKNDAVSKWTDRGNQLQTEYAQIVKVELDNFVTRHGTVDGSRLQALWFPQLQADIFISHSHQDKAVAVALAGWLYDELKLSAFVDSSVWGYADELLKRIDDKYCLNPGGETYSYESRNGSTSHVHMMLSAALSMMIDKTECLIFLNTKQSITLKDAVEKTKSPWLFAEIGIASIIRKRNPRKPNMIKEAVAKYEKRASAGPDIEYEVAKGLATLTEINKATLINWVETQRQREGHPLDTLYAIAG